MCRGAYLPLPLRWLLLDEDKPCGHIFSSHRGQMLPVGPLYTRLRLSPIAYNQSRRHQKHGLGSGLVYR